MKPQGKLLKPALCAGAAVLFGLILWGTPLGESWVNASYDYTFRFGSRAVTNRLAFILMDNAAFEQFHQVRGEPWDRASHAQVLNRLADDGCALVVCDSLFRAPRDAESDAALALAMRRLPRLVLMAAQEEEVIHPDIAGAEPVLPAEIFLQAAKTNWGVAWVDPDLDSIVRKQWPFPADVPYPSLPETAARVWGAHLEGEAGGRWLRYYSPEGPGAKLSYQFALSQPPGFFRHQIVFIGTQPKTSFPDGEPDEFATPYTRWTGRSSGGVEIMATAFLNLINSECLRRPAGSIEITLLVASGLLLGLGLSRFKPMAATGAALAFAGAIGLGGILLSYHYNYWIPWLVISGGQVPCAWAAVALTGFVSAKKSGTEKTEVVVRPPVTPGYELIQPPIGEGAYGKVWLARNRAGQWRALKAVYLAKFSQNKGPYEREFDGVMRYQAVSGRHPGLLRVDFVSEKKDECFYYVMELGDSVSPGWLKDPSRYKPRDLAAERAIAPGKRIPVRQCVEIGLELAATLEFLHQQGLTHRDIKPQNIVFVDGRPKLADLGLVAEIRPEDQIKTLVGTPGFMPPPPEMPGTPQADVFALGMVLYVMSTGNEAARFPDISTSLVDGQTAADFLPLNAVILTACQPDLARRYASAQDFRMALSRLKEKLEKT